MNLIEIVTIACGLAMDASAVSLVAAASGYADNKRAKFRLSFHFGLFQFIMPVLGWVAGIHFVSYVAAFDHWIAFGLLGIVGGRMILSGFDTSVEKYRSDPSRGWSLVMLSVATSIDALAIGLSLAVLDVNIWYPGVIIGGITALLSLIAIQIGKRIGALVGQRMEIIGGLILIGIGIRILAEHLLA
ncbi:manganese efflux pump [candidate division KSB1 bacterium]|nr:manganese efflux pump [candidate division KSB1 bacterium]